MSKDVKLTLRPDEDGWVVFCEDPIITSKQIALLIVKPSNFVSNANNSEKNTQSIIGRFEDSGWRLKCMKLMRGKEALVEQLIAHYPQPFFDSNSEDVNEQLKPEEREALIKIWGEEANRYPIYHPTQLVAKGIGSYQVVADVWHKGRGKDNDLLDIGDPAGINTVTKTKDAGYGKRRLLLVKDSSTLPYSEPFFIVNGFTAELVTKFSREGERIVFMVFGQESETHDLDYLRQRVVGETNPHHAKPGTIRSDALLAGEYNGKHPIISLDKVGIENNVVHLSENLAEARREIQLWVPEVIWYPPLGPFAPDISLSTWKRLKKEYVAGQQQSKLAVTSPGESDLQRLSNLPVPDKPVTISVNMMAGGSGGRFFGYEMPEQLRNKVFAPIVPINGKTYSFLELQLARLAGENKDDRIKSIQIVASESTSEKMQQLLKELSVSPALAPMVERTSVFTRRGIPRIVPSANDLLSESKFKDYCADHGLNVNELAADISKKAGEMLVVDGKILTRPPGHLSVILHYIYRQLRMDLKNKVEIAFIHIGEDTAAEPDPSFLGYARDNGAVATIEVVERKDFYKGGYLAKTTRGVQLVENSKNLGVEPPYYINACRIALNTKALAGLLASDEKAFMAMNEAEVRDAVTKKIVDKVMPRVEVKPINNYANWGGQFSYAIGQISEAVPTKFVVSDMRFPNIMTFKTDVELRGMLPIISEVYTPYL